QVFEVLTRGPFPTGDPEDDAVERHLHACHECRQLAEALRPAVALLHEAISNDDAMDLPEYQGALPWRRPQRRSRLSIARLSTASAHDNGDKASQPFATTTRGSSGTTSAAVRTLRAIAASLLIFALGALLVAVAWAPHRGLHRVSGGLFSSN